MYCLQQFFQPSFCHEFKRHDIRSLLIVRTVSAIQVVNGRNFSNENKQHKASTTLPGPTLQKTNLGILPLPRDQPWNPNSSQKLTYGYCLLLQTNFGHLSPSTDQPWDHAFSCRSTLISCILLKTNIGIQPPPPNQPWDPASSSKGSILAFFRLPSGSQTNEASSGLLHLLVSTRKRENHSNLKQIRP